MEGEDTEDWIPKCLVLFCGTMNVGRSAVCMLNGHLACIFHRLIVSHLVPATSDAFLCNHCEKKTPPTPQPPTPPESLKSCVMFCRLDTPRIVCFPWFVCEYID